MPYTSQCVWLEINCLWIVNPISRQASRHVQQRAPILWLSRLHHDEHEQRLVHEQRLTLTTHAQNGESSADTSCSLCSSPLLPPSREVFPPFIWPMCWQCVLLFVPPWFGVKSSVAFRSSPYYGSCGDLFLRQSIGVKMLAFPVPSSRLYTVVVEVNCERK